MKRRDFFRLATLAEALELCRKHFGERRTAVEVVPTPEALGRVLAEEVRAAEPVPHFRRSTMDGYAVLAADTHGASEGSPADLRVVGRVSMGEAPAFSLAPGEAVEIPTGGALPDAADAVVMVEYTHPLGSEEVQVTQAVSVGENVMQIGEDIGVGQESIPAGPHPAPTDWASGINRRCSARASCARRTWPSAGPWARPASAYAPGRRLPASPLEMRWCRRKSCRRRGKCGMPIPGV